MKKWFRNLWRPVYSFYHRGRYGWAPEDTWDFDSYLSGVISQGIGYFRKNSNSYPGNPPEAESPEKWDAILKRIQEGFEADLALEDPENQNRFDELKYKFDEGFGLFRNYYHDLWD